MADQTLTDFFSGPVMTQLANSATIAPGLPWVLPESFRTPSPNKGPVGTAVKFKKFNGDRTIPPLIPQGSTSQTLEVPGSTWEYATAIGSKANFLLEGEFLYAIKSGLPYVADNAKNEFVKRMSDFRMKFDNLRNAAINSMIITGAIYMDGNGGILPSSSGAKTSILAGGSGTTLTAYNASWPGTSVNVGDWSSASTDIVTSLNSMKVGYVQNSNYIPKTILYGAKIPGYLSTNTAMAAFMSRQPQINQKFTESGLIPQGLLGFNWVPAQLAYYYDIGGTIRTWCPANGITILPEVPMDNGVIDTNWYELCEAGTLVPRGIGVVAQDVEQFLQGVVPTYGRFSYATYQGLDPVALKAITGDYFLPALKSSKVHWTATVTA